MTQGDPIYKQRLDKLFEALMQEQTLTEIHYLLSSQSGKTI